MKISKLPNELVAKVHQLNKLFDSGQLAQRDKIAVFDFDETMIEGDIEEATYCYLASHNIEINYSWANYQSLLKKHEFETAYSSFKKAFAGISVKKLHLAVDEVCKLNMEYIDFYQDNISYQFPVPRPNQIMQEFISFLQENNFHIIIISASTEIIVRRAGKIWFNLEASQIVAMKQKIIRDNGELLLTGIIEGIETSYSGKVRALKEYLGIDEPIIAAGDSMSDLALLNKVRNGGIQILRNKKYLNILLEKINDKGNIIII